jgi:PrtD family type I secretion system ABC transporter
MNMFRREGFDADLGEGRENILRAMWRQSYPGLVAMGVFSVVFNILRLSTALYALQVLDRVVSSRSVETLVMLTAIVLVAVVGATLLGIIRRLMFMHWGGWIERQLGPRMFEIGIAQSSDSQSPSSLLRDVGRLRSFVSGPGLVSWIDVMFAPFFFVMVFIIAPQMGLVVLVASVAILILGVWNELATRNSRSAAFSAGADDEGLVTAVERNRETVGSLRMGPNFAELWSRSATERLEEGDRTRKTNIYFMGAMRFVRRCLRIAVLAFGIWLVIEGALTIGAVIASYYVGRTGFSLVQGAMLRWRDMIYAQRSYKRVRAALKQHETLCVSIGRSQLPVPLTFDHVSFRYPKQGTAIFRNVNLTVAPGEALYVIGPSAVGKTTFARLAAGVMMPMSGQTSAGQVRLGDVSVHRLVQSGQTNSVGYLPQHIQLFNGTIRENIARMTAGDIDLVVEAAKLVGIHDAIVQLPHGYDTVITEDEPLLSAGRRKSVALARAFYGWPSVIVLDEPEPHLDRQQRTMLNAAIQSLKAQGAIVVVTTQLKPPTLSIANKVLLFENGKTTLLEGAENVGTLRRQKSTSSRASD